MHCCQTWLGGALGQRFHTNGSGKAEAGSMQSRPALCVGGHSRIPKHITLPALEDLSAFGDLGIRFDFKKR